MIDCTLLAYEFDKNQFTLNPVYPSGEKDEDKVNDKLLYSKYNPAVLVLEDDIINKDGYGLKKGFYNVVADKYLDFILIYQSGKLKAKVPVVKIEVFESVNATQEKPKKMSINKFNREQEKQKQKYIKGENPDNFEYTKAEIHYIEDKNSYLIIYNSNNIELTGIIKF